MGNSRRRGIFGITVFLTFLCIYLFTSQNAYAQRKWIEAAIAQSDSLQVDKESSVWILVNDQKVEIYDDGQTKREVKKAVKLFKSSGLIYMSLQVHVTPWRQIKNVNGWLIKANGKVEKLKKNNIAQVASDISAGYYDDAMIYLAAFENVEIGDITAFEYTLTEDSNWDSYFQSFDIQVQEPVLQAAFEVEIPNGWQLYQGSHYAEACTYTEEKNKHKWTAFNLPYLPDEELMPPWSFMKRYIKVTCFDPGKKEDFNFADWNDAAVWSGKYMAAALTPGQEIIDFVEQNINTLQNKEEKLKAISSFIRDEIRYVAVEIGKGRFIPRDVSKTFFNRYGDCKDKVALMRSMLQQADIPSVAVLASVYGYVDPRLPSPLQFDHCIIGIDVDSVPEIKAMPNATVDGWILFDPTAQAQELGELPAELYGSKVMIADNVDSSLLRIPFVNPENNMRRYFVHAHLDKDGLMNADVTVVDYGTQAMATAFWLKHTDLKELQEYYIGKYAEFLPSVQLTDFTYDKNNDSTWITFHLAQNNYLIKSGDLNFLPVDFIYDGRLPALKKKERVHPIWFGTFKKIELSIDWLLDDNWTVETETDSTFEECEVVRYSSVVKATASNINIKSTYTSDGNLVDKEKYSEARKFQRVVSKDRNLKVKLINSK